ncbi:hypothetical protein L218DRAFT_386575 [Marasmius fiardii PR-910]|nr:hypothetical protein L218DRAFT_386575 [Marasmius fiardii PR-910]
MLIRSAILLLAALLLVNASPSSSPGTKSVECDKARNIHCENSQKCCPMNDAKTAYMCCPYTNGVCCKETKSCCPPNTTCGHLGGCPTPKRASLLPVNPLERRPEDRYLGNVKSEEQKVMQ